MTAPTTTTAGTASSVSLVVGSCVSLQFGAATAAHLFPVLGPWAVAALRLSIAAAILLVAVRPRAHLWTRHQWRSVLVLGVALAGMNGFFYASIARIPLGVAVAIEFLGPLLLATCLSRHRRDLLYVALALGGMTLLGLENAFTTTSLNLTGVAFALVAAAFWALYILATARVGDSVEGSGGLAVALVVAAVCVLPVGASGAATALSDPHLFAIAAVTAVLASVIPYTLELAALRRLPRHVFGVLLAFEPVMALVAGWLLLGQTVGVTRLAAIALVVIASIGITVTNRPDSRSLRRDGGVNGRVDVERQGPGLRRSEFVAELADRPGDTELDLPAGQGVP
jgi:inner membrane transporter RhtA